MYELSNPFSISFNMMKIKYKQYDDILTALNFLSPDDKVTCFINLETPFKYLSTIRDLEKKLISFHHHKISMTADIINLAAHYREFFRNNGLDTKIVLYSTDFDSSIGEFNESKFNEDYRSYYLTKYNTNPNIIMLTDALKEEVLPKAKAILDFVPDVYIASGLNIDSSMIPYIVSEVFPDRKNIIITGDICDTQYSYMDRFICNFMNRSISTGLTVSSNPDMYNAVINKSKVVEHEGWLSNSSMYTLLLSSIGDKNRSISTVYGLGPKTMKNIVSNSDISNMDVTSIDIIKNIFKEDIQDEITNIFKSIDLKSRVNMLSYDEKLSIKNQLVDRSDLNELKKLNNSIFKDYQIRIESLLN